jgi:transcriptional regulator of acetoin/glycerol metabolism
MQNSPWGDIMTWNPNLSCYEYVQFTSSIQKAWSTYVEAGHSNEIIRPDILISWQRSKKFGVDPFQIKIQEMVKQEDLLTNHEKNQKLLSFARPDMKHLADTVKGSETIITISDRNGLILDMYGDTNVLTEGEKIHFMPGAVWSEEVGGTNAIGTVIKTKKPVQILFNEHFCTGWHDWFCAASPILDPLTNELLGVIDISGKWKNVHPHTLGLAISTANHISKYIEKNIYQDGLQVNPFLATALGSADDGIVIVNTRKKIVKMNGKAESYFRQREIQTIDSLYELDKLVNLVLKGKEKITEKEISLGDDKGKFICSIYPIMIDYNLLGIVIRFRESKLFSGLMKSPLVQQKDPGSLRYTFDHMIGTSPAFLKIVNQARKAARLNSTLFLSGETGTGKELIAQAIHHASERKNAPFIAINCGAIPRELIESELFGYESGAFTGAKSKGSPGKFELAQGGTIFLDEIGDMPLNVQVHLLRILEEKVVTRIGGNKPIPVDVRVIAATHKNLMEAVRKGEFREDLLFRLRVIQLRLPSLRERISDIPLLVHNFIQKLGPQFGKDHIQINMETLQYFTKYSWPGNIRELKNVIEQSLFNMEGDTLYPYDLPFEILENVDDVDLTAESEKDQLVKAIKMMGGNITGAAVKLGISRATMYRKIKQYSITI